MRKKSIPLKKVAGQADDVSSIDQNSISSRKFISRYDIKQKRNSRSKCLENGLFVPSQKVTSADYDDAL